MLSQRNAFAYTEASVPLYYRVYTVLKDRIHSAVYAQGQRFPTERELVDEFAVSRVTIRKALELLQHEGWIRKARGKGSTVLAKAPDMKSVKLTGTIEDIIKTGLSSRIKIISFEFTEAPPGIAGLFDSRGSKFLKVERVRYVEDAPFSFSTAFLPYEIGSKIKKRMISKKPILEVLRQDLGISVTKGYQKIEAAVASPRIAEYLSVPIGFPLLRVERSMWDQKGVAVEYIVIYYRSDRYYYSVEFHV